MVVGVRPQLQFGKNGWLVHWFLVWPDWKHLKQSGEVGWSVVMRLLLITLCWNAIWCSRNDIRVTSVRGLCDQRPYLARYASRCPLDNLSIAKSKVSLGRSLNLATDGSESIFIAWTRQTRRSFSISMSSSWLCGAKLANDFWMNSLMVSLDWPVVCFGGLPASKEIPVFLGMRKGELINK